MSLEGPVPGFSRRGSRPLRRDTPARVLEEEAPQAPLITNNFFEAGMSRHLGQLCREVRGEGSAEGALWIEDFFMGFEQGSGVGEWPVPLLRSWPLL